MSVEKLLTVPELAEALGLSRSTVYEYIKRGMPTLKFQGARRFRPSDVESWLAR